MNPLFSNETLERLACRDVKYAWILFERWRAEQHKPDTAAERRRQCESELAWRRDALDIETENRDYVAAYQQRQRARRSA